MPYLLALLLIFSSFPIQAAENPQLTTMESEENATTDEATTQQTEQLPQTPEVFNVFTPQFMNALRKCKSAQESNQFDNAASTIQIIERKDEKCHLRYAEFDLYVPFDVLPNIHGFDDLQTLLRNPEIAHYNFQPQYIYNGLLYALNSCAQKRDYLGIEKKEKRDNKQIKQGLEAEFANDVCTVYLISELEVENVRQDYTVTCRIDTATIANLLNYYRELLDKYGEKRFMAQGKMRVRSEVENEQTRQADDELMFFMQQKGLCE